MKWIFGFFMLWCSVAWATTDLHTVAQHKQWKLLLGFRDANTSSIQSQNFFLSDNGKKDSYAELIATIAAFKDASSNGDSHPQCIYRGRYYWLVQNKLISPETLPRVQCREFTKFAQFPERDTTRSVSLIFATGYLGNPASYYGHLLLKLNSSTSLKSGSELDDIAINYGAKIPDNENMLLYILKGLTGIYPSSFTQKEFYYHLNNYTDGELRDLWEYRLNLSKDAHEIITGHLWEMLGQKHDYYFANRNCAYRMAELLELVTDSDLTNSVTPWVAPQSILQDLHTAELDGKPIVQSISYLPSRQSKLYKKFSQLTSEEQKLLRKIVQNDGNGIIDLYIDDTAKIRIADTLIDYYRVINPNLANNIPYQKIIQQRFSLPKGKPEFGLDDQNNPHLGHSPSYTSLGYRNSSRGSRATLRIRPVYYDQLDSGFGHIKGSSLSMLDTTISTNGSKLELENIDFLLIESLYGFSTKLPGDNKAAWSLRVGAEKADNDCQDCLGFIALAGRGYAKALLDDRLLFNAMLNIGAQGEKVSSSAFFTEAKLGFNAYVGEKWNVLTEISHREFINSPVERSRYAITARYQLDKETDVRLTLDKNETTAAMLSIGFYW